MSQSSRSPKDLSGESRALICMFTDVWPLSEGPIWRMGSEGGVWKNADAASLPSGDRGRLFPWRAVGCQGGTQVDSEYTAEEEAVGPGDAG